MKPLFHALSRFYFPSPLLNGLPALFHFLVLRSTIIFVVLFLGFYIQYITHFLWWLHNPICHLSLLCISLQFRVARDGGKSHKYSRTMACQSRCRPSILLLFLSVSSSVIPTAFGTGINAVAPFFLDRRQNQFYGGYALVTDSCPDGTDPCGTRSCCPKNTVCSTASFSAACCPGGMALSSCCSNEDESTF